MRQNGDTLSFQQLQLEFWREKEAWPLFLNEWKWPTLWARMNLNWVTKGILCNSVLFDLETAPLLIRRRAGDGCACRALWGECYNTRPLQQPACSQTQHQTGEATQMQLGGGSADTHVHTGVEKLWVSRRISSRQNLTSNSCCSLFHVRIKKKALSVKHKYCGVFVSEVVSFSLDHISSSLVRKV